jgi:hypothetical protein
MPPSPRLPLATLIAALLAAAAFSWPAPLPAAAEDDPASREAALGSSDFAIKLAAILASGSDWENLAISPFSAWLPLSALASAASGKERLKLLKAIPLAGLSPGGASKAASRRARARQRLKGPSLIRTSSKTP